MLERTNIEIFLKNIFDIYEDAIEKHRSCPVEIFDYIKSCGFKERNLNELQIEPHAINILTDLFFEIYQNLDITITNEEFISQFLAPLNLFLELDYDSKDFLDAESKARQKFIKNNKERIKQVKYFTQREKVRSANKLKGGIGLRTVDRIAPGVDRREVKGVLYYYRLFKDLLSDTKIEVNPMVHSGLMTQQHITKFEKNKLVKLDVNLFICHITFALGIKLTENQIRKIISAYSIRYPSAIDALKEDQVLMESECELWSSFYYRIQSEPDNSIPIEKHEDLEKLIVKFKRASIIECYDEILNKDKLMNELKKVYTIPPEFNYEAAVYRLLSDINMRTM